MASVLCKLQTHVTDVRIFKSHDEAVDHHKIIRGQFWFQVTDYLKINRTMIAHKKSELATVPFESSPSQLSSRDGLFQLIQCSVLKSKFFFDIESLAEKISAKTLSRFSFITATSCSNLIIAVHVDRIRTIVSVLQNLEFHHDVVSVSEFLHRDRNEFPHQFNNDEEDMDVDEQHNDDNEDDNDYNDDNDEYNNSQITVESPHQISEFDHDATPISFYYSAEEDMVDDEEDEDDDNNDENDDNEDNNDYNDYSDEYDDSFSGLEEDCFSNIDGFSEVTGLVDAKPHEVMISTDNNNDYNDDNDEYNNSQITTESPHQISEFDHDAVPSSFYYNADDDMEDDEEDMDDDDDGADDNNDDNEVNNNYNDDNDEYDNSFSGFEEDCFSNIIMNGFSEVTGLVDVNPHEVLNSTDCCSICLEEYGSDSSRVTKAETSVCSHMFHKDCIRPWLQKSSNSCPLCRSVFIARI